jgi:hypothetical protein
MTLDLRMPSKASLRSENSSTLKMPVFFKRTIKPSVCNQLTMTMTRPFPARLYEFFEDGI